MQSNPDFKDLFQCLNDAGARYLVVAAYDDLIRAKKAGGRPQDLLDVASLESSR